MRLKSSCYSNSRDCNKNNIFCNKKIKSRYYYGQKTRRIQSRYDINWCVPVTWDAYIITKIHTNNLHVIRPSIILCTFGRDVVFMMKQNTCKQRFTYIMDQAFWGTKIHHVHIRYSFIYAHVHVSSRIVNGEF